MVKYTLNGTTRKACMAAFDLATRVCGSEPCLAAALPSAVFACEWTLLPTIRLEMHGTQTRRENQAVRAERGRMEVLEMAGGSSVT